jgi:hypothetical protein
MPVTGLFTRCSAGCSYEMVGPQFTPLRASNRARIRGRLTVARSNSLSGFVAFGFIATSLFAEFAPASRSEIPRQRLALRMGHSDRLCRRGTRKCVDQVHPVRLLQSKQAASLRRTSGSSVVLLPVLETERRHGRPRVPVACRPGGAANSEGGSIRGSGCSDRLKVRREWL